MHRFLPCVAALALLTGCGADNTAEANAEAQVETMAKALSRTLVWKTEDIGFFVTQQKGVELLSIGGQKRSRTAPLRLVVRVIGKGVEGGGFFQDGMPTPVPDVVRCFELTVYYSDVTFDGADCPQGAPLTFRARPELPSRAVEQLKKRLPRKPDLAKVREAVRRLDLDPRITQEIAESEGVIGVALWEGVDGTCLFARVRSSEVDVWHPYRIVPGGDLESCTAIGAVNGYFERAFH
ncbi:hypothetical protein N5079_32135 [Planotetraspora sp. A-T 1434]|uniref:hypothetical protein n=1 Tax=Planotetraspora sp. A-T 1434 TaxID=2979219 RepID=UPI0021BF06AA|nr:hypothetical protein [Planotetraspora sp. A-T 1434]MCT9934866.1 hypothetical protein [Planotetraspora sp. A-T 1434]